MSDTSGELKHLGFVEENAIFAKDVTASAYGAIREFTPASVEPMAASVEATAQAFLPLWEWATKFTYGYLKSADDTIEGVNRLYVDSYQPSKEQTYKSMEVAVDYVKKAGLSGTAQAIMETGPSKASDKLLELWREVQKNPSGKVLMYRPVGSGVAVSKLLEYYMYVHDEVVGHSLYAGAWKAGGQVVEKLMESDLYKSFVQQLADPVMETALAKELYEHVKPAVQGAAAEGEEVAGQAALLEAEVVPARGLPESTS